jgi:1,4-dihydroxy-2-naphthoyl-CoA hydrolase
VPLTPLGFEEKKGVPHAMSTSEWSGLRTIADEHLVAVRDLLPYARTLGIELVFATAEKVACRLPWQPGLCTTAGTWHGGAVMGLADVSGALCSALNLPVGSSGTTTIESKTNFLRAVRDSDLTTVSRPLHVGRSTIVATTDLFDDQNRLAARVTQTQAVLLPF